MTEIRLRMTMVSLATTVLTQFTRTLSFLIKFIGDLMAVPKKKTSKSRRNMRRSHDALDKVNVIVDSKTGEYKLPHHMSLVDGTYNGRSVILKKADTDNAV